MNKFELSNKIIKSDTKDRIKFIIDKCQNKVVFDIGCVRHNAVYALNDKKWLHGKIKNVAKKVVGIDYIKDDVEILKKRGFDIIYGDITKKLITEEKYDVIVAGDIIEHLSNFEGFFNNCDKLLNIDGIIIVTTPNPFYIDEFYYVLIKNEYLVNPEHTCWIDPQTLNQLCNRFNYKIDEIYFIKNSWTLGNMIMESKKNQYDILKGFWNNLTFQFKLKKEIIKFIFNLFFIPFKLFLSFNSKLVNYSDYIAVLKRINNP